MRSVVERRRAPRAAPGGSSPARRAGRGRPASSPTAAPPSSARNSVWPGCLNPAAYSVSFWIGLVTNRRGACRPAPVPPPRAIASITAPAVGGVGLAGRRPASRSAAAAPATPCAKTRSAVSGVGASRSARSSRAASRARSSRSGSSIRKNGGTLPLLPRQPGAERDFAADARRLAHGERERARSSADVHVRSAPQIAQIAPRQHVEALALDRIPHLVERRQFRRRAAPPARTASRCRRRLGPETASLTCRP